MLGDDDRPEQVEHAKWMQPNKDKQVRAAANEKVQRDNEVAAKTEQVKAHLKAAGHKKVTWKSVKYTPPDAT